MKLKVVLGVITLMLLLAPVHTLSAQGGVNSGANSLTTSIFQVIPNVGTFSGSLTTTSFQVINGVINAVGTISGTLTGPNGVIGTLTNAPIAIPLTGVTGSCPILSLHTGVIDLTLLGLNVHLNPIDLTITAQSGPGNLLGNLLCAVSHLLDSNGSLTAITNLLNQILAAL